MNLKVILKEIRLHERQLMKARRTLEALVPVSSNGRSPHTIVTRAAKRFAATKPAANKGYKYKKGQHWTQRPENAAKLRRVIRNMQRAKG